MNPPLSAALLLACALPCASLSAAPAKPGKPDKTPPEEKAPPSLPAETEPKPAAQGTENKEPKPAADSGSQADPAKAIKRLDDSRYELNGIIFDKKTRAITLPAKVNMEEGLLEYALVHESGKVHESLLSTAVSPFDLNIVLLLLNWTPADTFFDLSDKTAGAMPVKNPKLPPAAQLNVTLDWKTAEGAAKSARLETLLLNLDQKGTVSDGPFTYTGSILTEDGTFMAKDTGSILALYVDSAALINNPREGNENDDIWVPDKTKVPPRDTPVTVTLSPLPPPAGTQKPAPKTPAKPKAKPAAKKSVKN